MINSVMIAFKPINVSSVAIGLIIIICGLNLNGLAYMLYGVGQVFSIVLFLASTYLLFKCGRLSFQSGLCRWYIGSFLTYIFFAAIFSIISSNDDVAKYLLTYGSSVLVTLATAAYFSSRSVGRELHFLKATLLLAAVSVWFSEWLFSVYKYPPLALDRLSGFFANANEAGIVSVTALVLTLALPSRWRFLQCVQLICAFGAVVITFSKASILVMLIIILLYGLMLRRILPILVFVAMISLIMTFAIRVGDLGTFELTASQSLRLSQLSHLVAGEVSSSTTTGRVDLLTIALANIEEQFPFGAGFGAFHHMVDGISENGVWQGVHNVYLMVLGEAGFVAMFVLMFANAYLISKAYRQKTTIFPLFYVIVLQFDMFSAHNVLGLRFHNMLIGVVIGLIIVSKHKVGGLTPHLPLLKATANG